MIQVDERYIDRLTEGIYLLISGRRTQTLDIPEDLPDNEVRQLYEYFNKMVEEFNKVSDFSFSLSRGELDFVPPADGKMVILQSFKSLQASLKHLTWVTQQIAGGAFNHKVDFMGDFSEAFNDMTRQLEEAFLKIQQQNEALSLANQTIKKEREKSVALLNNILPERVVKELEEKGYSAPKQFQNVVVFFSDFVDFTSRASEVDPVTLIDELNSMFKVFDQIVVESGGERIKTIGDAFFAVWGLNDTSTDASERAVDAAVRIRNFVVDRNKIWPIKWALRIGLHQGNLVGGIVGETKYIYDLFGDTVNTASRMESNSEPMKINVSEVIYDNIKACTHKYDFIERGSVNVKGKGQTTMFFVDEKTAE
jgi:class 3 adenylate cyclase